MNIQLNIPKKPTKTNVEIIKELRNSNNKLKDDFENVLSNTAFTPHEKIDKLRDILELAKVVDIG